MVSDFSERRARMVHEQLERRGIRDQRVLAAFARVPRERFVDPAQQEDAYHDRPLPIGQGQTISQPYIVALTVEALQLSGNERALDVGTGSGYAAAILAELCREVYSVERLPELASQAEECLHQLGYKNVQVRAGDGTLGWPEHAPYDAIAVAAAGPRPPPALLEQLALGGRLVLPVGRENGAQQLVRITRSAERRYQEEDLGEVRFVPLIGAQGWAEGP